jgi:hypothetical protein
MLRASPTERLLAMTPPRAAFERDMTENEEMLGEALAPFRCRR